MAQKTLGSLKTWACYLGKKVTNRKGVIFFHLGGGGLTLFFFITYGPNYSQTARVVGARPGLGMASQILGMPELAQIGPRPGCHTHGIDQIARPGPDPFAMGMPCPWHQPYCQAWARSVCQCYAIGILNYEFYALICFIAI